MNPIDRTLSSLPYVRSLFGDENVQQINKKFEIFSNASITKEKQVERLSITNQYDNWQEFATNGGRIPNMYYHQLLYNSFSDDKKRRIIDYRTMAQYSEVESALREICNEVFERDDQGETIKCVLRGDYNEEVKSLIEKEFQKFLHIFKFNERGWKYIWDFLVEGELFFENIVSIKKPHLGILGLTRIASERIDPLYYDLDNELIDCFLLRSKQPDQYPYQWGKFSAQASYGANRNNQILFLNDKQITYFYNDQWESESKKYRIPILASAHRPYRQLSLVEDATIIYMLVRSPERLVFNVDTGNLPPARQEAYMKKLMAQFWSKKTIATDGRIENVYDPQSMMENYWFAKPREGQGTTVESIGGGNASPDNLEILNFFVQKLYKSLHVPLSRLNSDTAFSDGENITREELRFAEFIISIQKMWAETIKNTFIVHLKLRGKKLLELSKELKIEEIMVPNDRNSQEKISMKVSEIFKDDFNFKCWDSYDILSEAVNEAIKERKEYNQILIENNIHRLQTIAEEIDLIKSQDIITENMNNNLLVLEQEANKISDDISFINSETERLEEDGVSWWDQYELKEEDIDIKMVEPSQFFQLREQQLFQLRYDNFNNISQNDMMSNTFAMKIYLGYKDNQILANQHFSRLDAAFRWELSQIEQNGPDFREKALKAAKETIEGQDGFDMASLGGGGGAGGGSLGGGGGSLPNFGSPLEGGEGGNAPAGGEGSLPEGGNAPAEGGGEPPSAPEPTKNESVIIDKQTLQSLIFAAENNLTKQYKESLLLLENKN